MHSFHQPKQWTRRQLLTWGITTLGAAGAAVTLGSRLQRATTSVRVPEIATTDNDLEGSGFNPSRLLREFEYGKLTQENGQRIREFEVVANSTVLKLNEAVSFVSWNLNGRIPGPTLRATEGDRIRVIFHNEDGHSHSMHFHGIHPANMDGIQPVRQGKTVIYEFDAKPYGVHLYHCHIPPVTRHISKGLYGMFIVDPPAGRPAADEMVLVMGGYDINNDDHNELYCFNGIPNYYRDRPIAIYQNQRIRLYLLNMIEFEAAVTFHLHANFFQVYRTGRTLKPAEETDVITMGVAERHILEFAYSQVGQFMFHPHQDLLAEHGCMGMFDVMPT
jgi:FtsP/CotA-like multicopper oxidase with cupredoxin domain